MTARLDAKVVLVTGGSSGIGRAVAVRAAAEGAAVVLAARGEAAGERVAAEIRRAGGRAVFAAADVTLEGEAAGLVATAVREFGRLDGVFNNAGGTSPTGPLPAIDDARWQAELDQNLTSVFYGLKHQIPALLAAGGGSIVNNASLAGVVGVPGMAAYTAAKHAVVGLTRAAALENADRGVRVNALVTGNVDTPLYRRLLGAPPVGKLRTEAPNPARRVADPDEVAAFVVFLLGDDARFVTGAALAADGGFTAQ
ncbi:SDR family NAD(P)-dependent oxidoreductase [Kitasatospora paranensis]|uniref:SDR family NAD(P)-dependent oxidoreductase n=1 Tax=Kitasatospora paranensis TaxID=258053 RepID=A0ABW2FVW7_9ACTN